MALRRFTSATILACVLWVLCGAYATRFVYRGWIPHDEGTIGQSAERVLSGEMPHRDFDEVYTGGLTYLHAASMKLLGVNLRAPRLVLFGFFMVFLATVYAIGRRVATPFAALAAMALAAAWSVPNYFVSLPSWYNLFFATFGVWALLRYQESGRRRWLFAAGACGGLSLLVKIAGLFYLAGCVLFLMYVERTTFTRRVDDRGKRSGFVVIAAIPATVLILLCGALAASVAPGLLQLFAPALGICLFVAWREWADGRGGLGTRVARLGSLLWPLSAGAAIPIALFMLAFWQQHALADLLRGVFVLPQRRLVEASALPPAVAALGLAVPYALLLARGPRPLRREWFVALALGLVLGVALLFGGNSLVYQSTWTVARAMPLVAVVVGLWIAGRQPVPGAVPDPAPVRARVFLVVTMAAVVSLVQFPYATPTYFCYAAPITMLAVLAIIFAQPRSPRRLHLSVAAFFFLFAVVFMNRSYGWNLGVQFLPYEPAARLDLPRGGLLVPEEDKRTYEEIVHVVQEHAQGGTIYAGPDCPEIYFLSGFANPTRAFFDFLTPVPEDEPWMAALLTRSPIRAVVVNTAPLFSLRLDPAVLKLLEHRFPSSQQIGRFIVRFD